MKNKLIRITIGIITFVCLMDFTACGDDGNSGNATAPQYGGGTITSSSATNEIASCLNGTNPLGDKYCCTNFGYRCDVTSSSSVKEVPSSSSQVVFDYLTSAKTMNFTLTYYKQKSVNWDASSNSYTDGDPRISFNIYFIQPNGDGSVVSTGILVAFDDKGDWAGAKEFMTSVPALTDTIKVCPSVIDQDVLVDDDKSSGYCYLVAHVGRMDDYTVKKQDDYKSTDYTLEWEWYLE